MNITDRLLTNSQFTRPGIPMANLKAIIVHFTGNPGSTAAGNRNWMESLKNQNPADNTADTYASCHYIVGLEGEILRLIPENEGAYHAGGREYTELANNLFFDQNRNRVYPHDKCIGIETCHPGIDGKFNLPTEKSLIELVADIAKRHSLTAEHVHRHYDVTKKLCPLWYVSNPNEWSRFKNEVKLLIS